VWLSGKWAQYMANRGIPYKYILEYYYPWTRIQ
jgi:peptidoglycan hydrolase-like amidase